MKNDDLGQSAARRVEPIGEEQTTDEVQSQSVPAPREEEEAQNVPDEDAGDEEIVDDGEEDDLTRPANEKKTRKKSGADLVVEILLEQAKALFTTPDGSTFVQLPMADHSEVLAVDGHTVRTWLAYRCYETHGMILAASSVTSGLNVIKGKAKYAGTVMELYNRVAPVADGGGFWYDLSNGAWEAVRIDGDGWQVVAEPPILFRRYQHQKPQVQPQTGGDFSKILDFVNVAQDRQLLFMVYVLSCFLPQIAHPVGLFTGPQGSAKTTAASVVRGLVDPSQIATFSYPSQPRELTQILSHNWMTLFDNVTSVPGWLSDTLCRACTGAGDSKRQLYTNDDDIIYNFRRCVGLTSVTSTVEMPDLLDRSLSFALEPIGPDTRLSEEDLVESLLAAMPALLGGAFDVLSTAITIKPEVSLAELPRMADFALWGVAIARALGYTEQEFLDAYEADIRDRNQDAVAAHPVGSVIKAMMAKDKKWRGTASELLIKLNDWAAVCSVDIKSKQWPKDAAWVTRKVQEIRADLQQIGISVQFDRTRKQRTIVLESLVQGAGSQPEPDDLLVDDQRLENLDDPTEDSDTLSDLERPDCWDDGDPYGLDDITSIKDAERDEDDDFHF